MNELLCKTNVKFTDKPKKCLHVLAAIYFYLDCCNLTNFLARKNLWISSLIRIYPGTRFRKNTQSKKLLDSWTFPAAICTKLLQPATKKRTTTPTRFELARTKCIALAGRPVNRSGTASFDERNDRRANLYWLGRQRKNFCNWNGN